MTSSQDDAAAAARLDFLKAAARHLHAESPSSSAHLLLSHNQLLLERSKPLSVTQHREFCAACGSIRLPDWPKKPFTEGSRAEARRRKAGVQRQREKQGRSGTAYKCMRCGRSKVLLDKRNARAIQEKPITAESAAETSSDNKPTVAEPTNASSKKRAKARKQQGLLAALQTKKNTKPSSSLDLLDFLQP
ncbi:hypothetical protein KEM55_002666 [Ascosphaera atra]|nr:hypothetical protein KEM55_002666 [Ascosphaera atra]